MSYKYHGNMNGVRDVSCTTSHRSGDLFTAAIIGASQRETVERNGSQAKRDAIYGVLDDRYDESVIDVLLGRDKFARDLQNAPVDNSGGQNARAA